MALHPVRAESAHRDIRIRSKDTDTYKSSKHKVNVRRFIVCLGHTSHKLGGPGTGENCQRRMTTADTEQARLVDYNSISITATACILLRLLPYMFESGNQFDGFAGILRR